MLVSDPVDAEWFQVHVPHAHLVFGLVGAVLVVLVGKLLKRRSAQVA